MDELKKFNPKIQDLTSTRQPTVVKIHMDKDALARVVNRLDSYGSIPKMFVPAMEAIGDYVRVEMIPTVFSKEGPGWKGLSRRSQRERAAAGYGARHPILKRTGDLYEELTQKSHPKHIEVIKVGKMARIEIGGSSAKFIENQMGKSSAHLPARPMIPGTGSLKLADKDRIQMRNIIDRIMSKQLQAI